MIFKTETQAAPCGHLNYKLKIVTWVQPSNQSNNAVGKMGEDDGKNGH